MNKKLAAALSGGAVLVLTLSGCSDDSGDKVNDWAKKVCDQFQPQLQKITDANASIQQQTADNSKPADVRKADSIAFQQISQAYKELGAAVESAGPPPVDDGETMQKEAVKELNDASKAYAALKVKVEGIEIKDQAKFADGLKGIAEELNKIGTNGDQALKKLESDELGTAMSKQKGCQKPTASTGPASPGGSAAPDAAATPSASASEEKASEEKSEEKKA
ncbi:small secreted protein [Streptomyces bacillaris]|uniref:small secreted protein n=1 Tax=Streptomyces bacillaris TaxID=68179 RepID=UPI00364517F7